jgi:F-type H+-transporting ATPase subunit delta
MKKISAKKYAQALYQTLVDLDRAQIRQEIDNFLWLLAKNKNLKLAERIVVEFEKYAKEQEGIIEAEVISAQKLTGVLEQELAERIKKEKKVKKVNITNIEDPSLIGGVVVKIGDDILDVSLKTRLDTLKQALTKS